MMRGLMILIISALCFNLALTQEVASTQPTPTEEIVILPQEVELGTHATHT